MYKIRIAFITDIAKILEVAEATETNLRTNYSQEQIDFMYERMYSNEAILQQMQDGHTFLMCLENDKILGFISYIRQENNIINIPKIYVKPEAHGKGIGKLLLQEVEKIAQKNKVDFFRIECQSQKSCYVFL